MTQTRRLAVPAALTLIAALSPPALAEEAAPPVAVAARLTQDANSAQLVFDLSRSVDARAYTLGSPDRIVVDVPEVNFQIDPSVGRFGVSRDASLIKAFRFGLLAPGKSRIVIDLQRSACPSAIETKPIIDGAPASRLKIELKPCDAAAFAALGETSAASAALEPAAAAAPPVIVLDPGHGGADGGAHGVGGVVEKTLVMAFCRELKRQLEANGRFKIVMTRDGDQYVDLDQRVAIAREANASLFISIHDDTLSEAADVNGATVYTAADRASDAEAARIAAHENASSRAPGGAKGEDDAGVADILFDLTRRESRAYAHIFSRGMVENLRGAARLNRNPERSASFVVLKAPEFPSVLVELGYLSNPQDVQALSSPEWRTKAAAAMVKAIESFFADSAGAGDIVSVKPGAELTAGPTNASGH
jgi:N-acetylmuramoyl-L-alanine amidase